MANKENLAMIVAAIPEEVFPFSEDFLSFIYQDEMKGVFDLFEMTKNATASKQIPPQVRAEYEQHYMVAGKLLDNMMSKIKERVNALLTAQANGESEIILEHPDILMTDTGAIIINTLPVEDKLIKSLENTFNKFKEDYKTIPQEMKVFIINSAVEQFVAKCAAKEAH